MIIRCTGADGRVEVSFVADHLGLGELPASVVGDFNNWDPYATPVHNFSGHRRATATVAPGRYRFRYLCADVWYNDEAADDYEPNDVGGMDSVLDLTEPRRWVPRTDSPPAVERRDHDDSAS